MSRPNGLVARDKRDELARLIAADLERGGLDEAHRNIARHVKSVRIDPWRALKLSYDPSFVGQVERLWRT